ncbi:right-handed parallel beta-helix repeat-containing protein [Lacipirellula parvula]|uniref:Probable pectate lyase C n=1 Tax=Lacipirellula parvula TaxID=2650471 RepID=A0A5K7XJ10_9BACT|nr:right-handed parallel beta-helix repeat-containing protein [Lacipirellula parvula]BBO36057.1 hypothetical protein PLANPX_5669 [Lacipirellula parvula]
MARNRTPRFMNLFSPERRSARTNRWRKRFQKLSLSSWQSSRVVEAVCSVFRAGSEATRLVRGSMTSQIVMAGGGRSLRMEGLEERSLLAADVYVDDSWSAYSIGTLITDGDNNPGNGNQAAVFGTDAFATIQGGVNAVDVNGTVHVNSGTYNEDVLLNKAGIGVLGAGSGTTTVIGPIGGVSGATFTVQESNIEIAGFTITRAGNNTTDWNDPNLNSAGIAIQGLTLSGTKIHDSVITGNRTGVDVNNSNDHTIRNNNIVNNRTGLIFRNQTDNLTVEENNITGNWTVGVVFLDGSGGTNSPVQTAAGSDFNNNNISGNWYGQVVDRQTGGSLPAPGGSGKDFEGNWFGTANPTYTTANSAEPGYAGQIPVAFGGSATAPAPGTYPEILGAASANIDSAPALQTGLDTNVETTPGRGIFGFQGFTTQAEVWVDNDWVILVDVGPAGLSPGDLVESDSDDGDNFVTGKYFAYNAYDSVTAALAGVSSGGKINILAGTFSGALNINKDIDVVGQGAAQSILNSGPLSTPITATNNAEVLVRGLTVAGGIFGVNVDGADVTIRESIVSGGSAIGILVDSNGELAIVDSTLTGAGAGTGVVVVDGVASITGSKLSGRVDGVIVGADGSATLSNNDLSAAFSGKVIQADPLAGVINASGNYWGTTSEGAIAAKVLGTVDFSPYLAGGSAAGVGFAGDFSLVYVTTQGAQAEAVGRIQDGVNRVLNNGTVQVNAGSYIETVTVANRTGVKLLGAGAASTTIAGPAASPSDSATIRVENSAGTEIDGFTITRTGNTAATWASNGMTFGVLLASGATSTTIENNILTGNRTALDIRNVGSGNNVIQDNNIVQNRTGVIIWDLSNDNTIQRNSIAGNFTVGVLMFDTSNEATGNVITNNAIAGNWYSQVEDRRPSSTSVRNFSGNWFGTNAIVTTTAPAGEPGYAALIPNIYPGGTAIAPGAAKIISGAGANNVDYSPWLDVGTNLKAPGQLGFDGDFSTLHVDDASPQAGVAGRITEGLSRLDDSPAPGTLIVHAGAYGENVDSSAKAVKFELGTATAQVVLTGNLALSADDTLVIELNGTSATTNYDNFVVNGSVALNGATLDLSRGFAPAPGDSFVIAGNDGLDPVNGTFAGLAEGSVIYVSGIPFTLSYAGGDGNDVTLTIAQPSVVYVNDTWGESVNSSGGTLGTVEPGDEVAAIGPGDAVVSGLIFGYNAFASIQDAIDAVAVSGTVNVLAGTYAEQVIVDKSLELLGPNASLAGNAGGRAAEAIILPTESDPDPDTAPNPVLVYVAADNVRIAGLSFDGDNSALTSGTTLNGADLDAEEAIASYEGVGGITVENNIIRNFSYTGVDFYNFNNGGAATSGNAIRQNLIENLGAFGWGIGILVYNNFYADVTNNVINDVRVGVQTGNFSQANPGVTGSISGNTISASRAGVWHNLAYSAASSLTINGNTISADSDAGILRFSGIWVTSIATATSPVITGNTITVGAVAQGQTAGYDLWNNSVSGGVTISGGSVTGANYGVWVNNFDSYPTATGSNGDSTSATITGVAISNASIAGVYAKDNASNTNSATVNVNVVGSTITGSGTGVLVEGDDATATLSSSSLTGNTTGVSVASGAGLTLGAGNAISGGTTGIRFDGAGVGLTGLSLGDVSISASSDYITLANSAFDNLDLDATGTTLGGIAVAAMTAAEKFAAADKITDELDNNTLGLVLLATNTIYVTPATSPTATDNDYTRIKNAIEAAGDNWTIDLLGTFNWTETNAAASWALGNDGVSGTDDDYSITVAGGLEGVTLTASSGLGSAIIQGPGDLATVNLEGFLSFAGGANAADDNKNWTISNLDIRDFDLSIGMFNSGAGVDAFDGTTIVNNRIRIATDLNATVAPIDVNQNIGIHYSFGVNQTIQGNFINIPGNGVSDSANLRFATSVAMQSNTSGGAVYDGLLIDGNVITVLNAQSADPETILGIWENGHAHSSDITVSNNTFTNSAVGNNPAANLQRAFRVTSHSSGASTVTYSNNTVSGANLGFQWIAGSNFTGNLAVQVTGNTLTNVNTGFLIQSNGVANISGSNSIVNSGAMAGVGVGIDVASGSASVANNQIQGLGVGVRFQAGAGGSVAGNDFDDAVDNATDLFIATGAGGVTIGAGNAFAGDTFFIDNQSTQSYDLSSNGTTFDEANNYRIEDKIHHRVDADLALATGLVTWVANNVYVTTPGVGSTDSSIQRGIDAAAAGNTVNVEAGTYDEALVIGKALTLLGSVGGGGAPATILRPLATVGNLIELVSSTTGAVAIKNFELDGNNAGIRADYGIRINSGTTFASLTLDNLRVKEFRNIGLSIDGDGAGQSVDSVTLSNSVFTDNGDSGLAGAGAISFFSFNEGASITNVDVTNSVVNGARSGIQFRGAGSAPYAAAGTISLNDIDVSGLYQTQMIGIQRYSNAAGISFTDVKLGGATSAITGTFGASLRFDSVGAGTLASPATLNLGNTTFRGLAPTSAQPHEIEIAPDNAFAFLRLDGTGTSWSFGGSPVAAASLTLAQAFAVEDRILHYVDKLHPTHGTYKGFVDVQAGQAFVTDDSTSPNPLVGDGSIQRAVDVVATGGTVHVEAGSFTEAVSINRHVNIIGAGSGATVLNQPVTNDIITLTGSGASNANPLLLEGLQLKPTGVNTHGIIVPMGASIQHIKLDDLVVTGGSPTGLAITEIGLRITDNASANDVVIVDSLFENLNHGVLIEKHLDITGSSNVTNLVVTNTGFEDNQSKGFYAEKLSNATFTNVWATGNGNLPYFVPGAGIEINLKGNVPTYTNLVFNNLTVSNNGAGAAAGAGLQIKARGAGDTGGSGLYAANPATLTNVQINGGSFTGNRTGIRVGEPGQSNTSPTGVVIDDVSVSNSTETGIHIVGGAATIQGATLADNPTGIRVQGTGRAIITDDSGDDTTISGGTVGIEVNSGRALVQNTAFANTADIGVLIQNGGIADLGQTGPATNFTGLGVSVGGNDFSSYVAAASTSVGAIVNLNVDAVTGRQGAPPDVTAFGNAWAVNTPVGIENVVYHDSDLNTRGFVDFAAFAFTGAVTVSSNTINEGGAVTVSGSFTNVPQAHTVTINWGDGSAPTIINLIAGVYTFNSAPHTYEDDVDGPPTSSVFPVTVTITDASTASIVDNTSSVTVNNVAPTVTISGGTLAGDGQTLNFTFTTTDPGESPDDVFALQGISFASLSGGANGMVVPGSIVFDPSTGAGSFSVLFSAPPGSGTVEISVGVADDDLAAGVDTHVVTVGNTLRVTNFVTTDSGFDVTFNRALDLSVLNLYDGVNPLVIGDILKAADIVVHAAVANVDVKGSVVWNAATNTLSWVKTGGPLTADTYQITLVSGTNAFVDTFGNTLDGNGNFVAGDDYQQSFNKVVVGGTPIVSLPDFARAPGQAVDLTANNTLDTMLPVRATGVNVQGVNFELKYNPALLTINPLLVTPALAGWNVLANLSAPDVNGLVTLTVAAFASAPGFAFSGTQSFVSIAAAVPTTAPFGAVQVLRLQNAEVNDDDAQNDAAIQKVAFPGDANGSGILPGSVPPSAYTGFDSTLIARVVVGQDTGFDAYPLIDPAIVGDASGNGSLNAFDASLVLQEASGTNTPEVPDEVGPGTGGFDPFDPLLSIGDYYVNLNGPVTIPVNIKIETTVVGIISSTYIVKYDTSVLDFVDVQLGDQFPAPGWSLAATETSPGVIQVAMFATNPSSNFGGAVVELGKLNFQVVAANPGLVSLLQIDPVDPNESGLVWTKDNGSAISTFEADFDRDGDVDGNDLSNWNAGFGTLSGATVEQGDANRDGAVNGADFLIWQRQFGSVVVIPPATVHYAPASAVATTTELPALSTQLEPAAAPATQVAQTIQPIVSVSALAAIDESPTQTLSRFASPLPSAAWWLASSTADEASELADAAEEFDWDVAFDEWSSAVGSNAAGSAAVASLKRKSSDVEEVEADDAEDADLFGQEIDEAILSWLEG